MSSLLPPRELHFVMVSARNARSRARARRRSGIFIRPRVSARELHTNRRGRARTSLRMYISCATRTRKIHRITHPPATATSGTVKVTLERTSPRPTAVLRRPDSTRQMAGRRRDRESSAGEQLAFRLAHGTWNFWKTRHLSRAELLSVSR